MVILDSLYGGRTLTHEKHDHIIGADLVVFGILWLDYPDIFPQQKVSENINWTIKLEAGCPKGLSVACDIYCALPYTNDANLLCPTIKVY